MACVWILVLAIVAGISAASDRIVGGRPARLEDYPSIVQVEAQNPKSHMWRFFCGASVLTSRFVMSAAHCFEGEEYSPRFRRIRAGSRYSNMGGMVVYVEKEFNHPSYDPDEADGDINVVKLFSPLIFSPVIQQAIIVPQDTIIPDNIPVNNAGWGRLWYGGPLSGILRHVTVFTINNDLCRERYKKIEEQAWRVTSNMLCAGILDVGGKDACNGDSGSPVYFNNIVIGVVSWGHGCANATFPGVNTNVASYTSWIIDTVRSRQ